MAFERETEMSRPVRRWLEGQGLVIKAEFALPWGICDLVGLSFDERKVVKRLSFRQFRPVGPMRRVELLQHIPDQESGSAITLGRLQKSVGGALFGLGFEQELGTLIADRFVVRRKGGSLQKVNGWAPLHDRIIAVELKLSRVCEALAQATMNRAFATESYIALPAKVAERLTNGGRYSELEKVGIGVLGVTASACKVVLPVSHQRNELDANLQMHCVERFWRTRGNSSSIAGRRVRVS